jgi:hypothetical protein
MRHPFDLFAKRLTESALSPSCTVETSEKVAAEILEMDTWIEPMSHAIGPHGSPTAPAIGTGC